MGFNLIIKSYGIPWLIASVLPPLAILFFRPEGTYDSVAQWFAVFVLFGVLWCVTFPIYFLILVQTWNTSIFSGILFLLITMIIPSLSFVYGYMMHKKGIKVLLNLEKVGFLDIVDYYVGDRLGGGISDASVEDATNDDSSGKKKIDEEEGSELDAGTLH